MGYYRLWLAETARLTWHSVREHLFLAGAAVIAALVIPPLARARLSSPTAGVLTHDLAVNAEITAITLGVVVFLLVISSLLRAPAKLHAAVVAQRDAATGQHRTGQIRDLAEVLSLTPIAERFQPRGLPTPRRATRLLLAVRNDGDDPVQNCRLRRESFEVRMGGGTWRPARGFNPGMVDWEGPIRDANLAPGETVNYTVALHEPTFGVAPILAGGWTLGDDTIYRVRLTFRADDRAPVEWTGEFETISRANNEAADLGWITR